MAEAHNAGSEQRIALQAAGSQGNMEVVVHIDGKEEASSQNTAQLVGTSSFYRRRHKKSLPKKQISLGRNNQGNSNNNNSFGVLIDAKEEEAPQLPDDVVVVQLSGPDADAPEAETIAAAGSQDADDQEETSPPAPREEEEVAAADDDEATKGLPEQALMTIIGHYIERVGPIIALIGLGTITSSVGGLFTRQPPSIFVYFLTHQDQDDDDTRGDRDALTLYYKCLPAFFLVGLLELCYGIWVSRNQELRAGKRAKTILILSAVLLIVTVCFTDAGISV